MYDRNYLLMKHAEACLSHRYTLAFTCQTTEYKKTSQTVRSSTISTRTMGCLVILEFYITDQTSCAYLDVLLLQ